MITGKEALIALANGEEVEYEVVAGRDVWNKISSMSVNLILADNFKFRLKHRTITINGVACRSEDEAVKLVKELFT